MSHGPLTLCPLCPLPTHVSYEAYVSSGARLVPLPLPPWCPSSVPLPRPPCASLSLCGLVCLLPPSVPLPLCLSASHQLLSLCHLVSPSASVCPSLVLCPFLCVYQPLISCSPFIPSSLSLSSFLAPSVPPASRFSSALPSFCPSLTLADHTREADRVSPLSVPPSSSPQAGGREAREERSS